ncbi:MAG: hypothetical protein QXR63_01075 [Candidatus Bathyarchaeia archaeon]
MNLKIKWISISAFLIVAIVVGTIITNGFINKQNAENDEYRLNVEGLLKETIKVFEEIRGFNLEDVEVEVVTISWAKENWGKAYAEADKEKILREERIYKALFMIPEDASLYEAEVEWSGMIVSAVWQNKIYVVKEYFNPSDKFNAEKTLIHELTHMMQGKYFSMPDIPTFDGEKAKAALTEGDACLMEEVYENKTKEGSLIVGITYGKATKGYYGYLFSSEISASLPDSISRLNYFPYAYGLKFVKTLYAQGGWESVNRAYGNPPTTTEQIMHPEKYFADEASKEVEAPVITEEGWQRVKSERFGEYFILVMLEKWVPNEAVKAAEGWGGDNFTYYERGNDYLLTWNITWDSQEDASEFSISFQAMMNKVDAKEEAKNLWQKYDRHLSLTLKENSTLIVISTDKALVQKIVGMQ